MSNLDKAKSLLLEIPEAQLTEVIDFLKFLSIKNDKSLTQDLLLASDSGTKFWDNAEDEVWDNV